MECNNELEARVLIRANGQDFTQDQIEFALTRIFATCLDASVFIFGFYYVPREGIYAIGPREELEKMTEDKKRIEDFDFKNYIRTTTDNVFWTTDYLTNPEHPSLMRRYRNKPA